MFYIKGDFYIKGCNNALKWPMCDFENQGYHLIITIRTEFCVEFVKKCIYYGLPNTVVYVKDNIIRYNWPKWHFRFTKSGGNLEILTSIYAGCICLLNKP